MRNCVFNRFSAILSHMFGIGEFLFVSFTSGVHTIGRLKVLEAAKLGEGFTRGYQSLT